MVSLTENDRSALINVIGVHCTVGLFVIELCQRVRGTGRRVIAWRRSGRARYGAGRRARAAASPPPCRTSPRPRASPAPPASPRTTATAGTALPLNGLLSTRRTCSQVYANSHDRAHFAEDRFGRNLAGIHFMYRLYV